MALWRSRLQLTLWLGATVPATALCMVIYSKISGRASQSELLIALAFAGFVGILPSVPGLLCSSLSLGRSSTAFLSWSVGTAIVQVSGLVIFAYTFTNPETQALGPVPIGLGPSTGGMLLVGYVLFSSLVYTCVAVFDCVRFFTMSTNVQRFS